jgi:formylglycine-generating enzyme required for sulfatase activity
VVLSLGILLLACQPSGSSPNGSSATASGSGDTPGSETAESAPDTASAATSTYVAEGLFDPDAAAHDLQVEARLDGEAVTVTLGWTGSWRNAQNWDAAWVFLKARRGDGPWQPLRLTPGRSSVQAVDAGPPPTVDVPDDGMGAFLYRSAAGSTGRNDWAVQLIPQSLPGGGGPLDVQAFGLEMVYVPAGPFYVGDGTSRSHFLTKQAQTPRERASAHVTDEGVVLTVSRDRAFNLSKYSDSTLSETGVYVDGDDGINPEGARPEPSNAAFPTGYDAFYSMKYELTQGEYARFLNTLRPEQRSGRILSKEFRNALRERDNDPAYYGDQGGSIQQMDDGSFQAEHPHRACNFLKWRDVIAYLDWARLRPMTELEFEKAARGPRPPVPGEFAWGTTGIKTATWVDDDTTAEARYADGNAVASLLYYLGREDRRGPVRAGIFGENTDASRDSTGASYYGLMEMSGNVAESVVTLSKMGGRQFEGSHGDGILTPETGRATNDDWPALQRNGGMMRGGGWALPVKLLHVSDRLFNPVEFDTRGYADGMRGARTAP